MNIPTSSNYQLKIEESLDALSEYIHQSLVQVDWYCKGSGSSIRNHYASFSGHSKSEIEIVLSFVDDLKDKAALWSCCFSLINEGTEVDYEPYFISLGVSHFSSIQSMWDAIDKKQKTGNFHTLQLEEVVEKIVFYQSKYIQDYPTVKERCTSLGIHCKSGRLLNLHGSSEFFAHTLAFYEANHQQEYEANVKEYEELKYTVEKDGWFYYD